MPRFVKSEDLPIALSIVSASMPHRRSIDVVRVPKVELQGLPIRVGASINEPFDCIEGFVHFGGLPGCSGTKDSISERRMRTLLLILRTRSLPFPMSRAIACRETPRIRAASACETHSFPFCK